MTFTRHLVEPNKRVCNYSPEMLSRISSSAKLTALLAYDHDWVRVDGAMYQECTTCGLRRLVEVKLSQQIGV